jgi:hypothetical protein
LLSETLRTRLERVGQAYAPHEHRPLAGYLAAMGAFGTLAASLAGAAKVTGRPAPERVSAGDVALLSIATHKLSRSRARSAWPSGWRPA